MPSHWPLERHLSVICLLSSVSQIADIMTLRAYFRYVKRQRVCGGGGLVNASAWPL